jgi:hypothetical protein
VYAQIIALAIKNDIRIELKKLNTIKAQQAWFRQHEGVINSIPFDSCEAMNLPHDAEPFCHSPIARESE